MQSKILLTLLLIPLVGYAYAQNAPLINDLEIADEIYSEGETVVISGRVGAVIESTPIIIQIIFNEGNIIDVAQITPAEDGSFTHTILAQGPLWQNDGEYTARASYGTNNVAEVTFSFLTKQESSDVENIFEVDIDGSGTFDVKYTINGGTVQNIIIDNPIYALVTVIDSTSDGSLTLELPRESIDAKTVGCNGEDDIYIVLIDQVEVPYKEISSDDTYRVITIEFEEGDNEIEIIGTCVVPEFGGMALVVMAATIVSILLVSKRSLLRV